MGLAVPPFGLEINGHLREGNFIDNHHGKILSRHVHALPEGFGSDKHRSSVLAESDSHLLLAERIISLVHDQTRPDFAGFDKLQQRGVVVAHRSIGGTENENAAGSDVNGFCQHFKHRVRPKSARHGFSQGIQGLGNAEQTVPVIVEGTGNLDNIRGIIVKSQPHHEIREIIVGSRFGNPVKGRHASGGNGGAGKNIAGPTEVDFGFQKEIPELPGGIVGSAGDLKKSRGTDITPIIVFGIKRILFIRIR